MINFTPKGTDTVPAMLTPGEFVVNRAATQKNLPLLNSINSNRYSGGGKVKYYDQGGYVDFADRDQAKREQSATDRTQTNKETIGDFIDLSSIDGKKNLYTYNALGVVAGNANGDQAGLSDYFLDKAPDKKSW